MSLILAILSLITALLPIADRNIQQHQAKQSVQTVQTALQKMMPPPEAGQANVVFHDGAWWKHENGQWLVWRPNPAFLAQGGGAHVSR